MELCGQCTPSPRDILLIGRTEGAYLDAHPIQLGSMDAGVLDP